MPLSNDEALIDDAEQLRMQDLLKVPTQQPSPWKLEHIPHHKASTSQTNWQPHPMKFFREMCAANSCAAVRASQNLAELKNLDKKLAVKNYMPINSFENT